MSFKRSAELSAVQTIDDNLPTVNLRINNIFDFDHHLVAETNRPNAHDQQ